MLSIGKLGIGQERYYIDKVAQGAEDYYSGEGEVPGRWMGDAAADLGLSGEVGPDQLTAMLVGDNPATGEPLLGRRGVPAKGSVPGFDLTFSAPKSVSLTWALGGPGAARAAMEAHHRSVQVALGYLQREACWTRRGAGGHEFVHGNGFLAAGFDHRSSRAGDPQLHTHVLIANATKGPDGRWTRLYHPAIYDHAKTASYLYEANLRHELSQSLGIGWQEVRNGIAEIEGFADSHLREFSTRRAEILEAAGGPEASARARQVATLATRGAKQREVPSDLHRRWAERAQEIGLDGEQIAATQGTAREQEPVTDPEQIGLAVSAHASHFDRRDAVRAVADLQRQGMAAAEVEHLADRFLASEEAIPIGRGPKGERFTTRRIWEIERGALDAAERMREEGGGAAGEAVAERVLASHPTLKADQREMVRRLLANSERLAIVIGEAGTGKSYAILAAAKGWEQAGIAVRVAAPTWRAANVLRAEGLDTTTVASMLARMKASEEAGRGNAIERGSVLLVDEAGMVGSADLARLIDAAERAEAKVVLVGDPEQLGEIEAGGLFRAISEQDEAIRLDEVIRHRHQAERDAARMIREGEGAEALDLYRSEERVVIAPDAQVRREAMVSQWRASFAEGEDAVMVAKQNVEVERLNAMARETLKRDGALGATEIEVGEASFAAGDQIITRVNDRAANLYNRERWRVAEVDPAQGSMVLEGIDQEATVEVGPDYLARTNPHSGDPAVRHAYAVTTYSAQGTTVDRAFVAADPSMDKQELYVALSRSRGETMIFATPEIGAPGREEIAPAERNGPDDLRHIAEASTRDRAQRAAHDEALRTELRGLPGEELRARRTEIATAAWAEAGADARHAERQRSLRAAEARLRQTSEECRELESLPPPERARYAERIEFLRACEQSQREARERSLESLQEAPPAESGQARTDLRVAEQVEEERVLASLTAAKLSPPEYVVGELGERPSDPDLREAWDRGVAGIERYRYENGITDRDRALGKEPSRGVERSRWREQRSQLAEQQQRLGLAKGHEAVKSLGRDMAMGR